MLTKTFWKKAASAVLSIAFAISVVAGVPAVESRADAEYQFDTSNATSNLTQYLNDCFILEDLDGYTGTCISTYNEMLRFLMEFDVAEETYLRDFSVEVQHEGEVLMVKQFDPYDSFADYGDFYSYWFEFSYSDFGMARNNLDAGEYTFTFFDDQEEILVSLTTMFYPLYPVSATSNHVSPLNANIYYACHEKEITESIFIMTEITSNDDYSYVYRILGYEVNSTDVVYSSDYYTARHDACASILFEEIENYSSDKDYIFIALDYADNIIYSIRTDYPSDQEEYQTPDNLSSIYAQYIEGQNVSVEIPNYNIANLSGVEINRAEAEAFVTRNYELVLGRTPDSTGLNNWVNSLVNYQNTGAHVAYGFFFSQEYINSNTSNEEFVTTLYNVFLNRQPDAAGMADWVGQLEAGATREQVFAGVANSREFFNLCVGYGITAGHYVQGVDNTRQQNINAFVARLYGICLGRIGDYDGQASWVRQLINGENSGAGVGYGFFFSPEAQARFGGVPENYVTTMYEVFLGRTPDQAGYNSWVHQLYMGASDMSIFRGFAHSQEYTNICNNYGITRGTV